MTKILTNLLIWPLKLAFKAIFWSIKLIWASIVNFFNIFTESARLALKILITVVILFVLAFPFIRGALRRAEYLREYEEKGMYRAQNLPKIKASDNLLTNDLNKYEPLVRLHTPEGVFFCSGSVISNDYILTAAHCIGPKSSEYDPNNIQIENTLSEKTGTVAKTVFFDKGSDLALLQGDFSKFNHLPVALYPDRAMHPQQPLMSCGFPHGDHPLCMPFKPFGALGFKIGGSSFLYPGMSGGPTTDATGTIVGVNFGVAPNGTAIISPIIGLFNNANIQVEY